MKKSNFITRLLLPLLLIACFPGHVLAAPYGPDGREVDWEQPGGEKIKLRVFGDEYYGRTETAEGYTVVYHPDDGAYHYAELAADATSLKPSGVKAHLPPRGGQTRHLDLPKTRNPRHPASQPGPNRRTTRATLEPAGASRPHSASRPDGRTPHPRCRSRRRAKQRSSRHRQQGRDSPFSPNFPTIREPRAPTPSTSR